MNDHILNSLSNKWPSAIVARKSIADFTGGMFTSKTMAKLDSSGEGPKVRIRIGRDIAYPVESLIEWLIEKAEILN